MPGPRSSIKSRDPTVVERRTRQGGLFPASIQAIANHVSVTASLANLLAVRAAIGQPKCSVPGISREYAVSGIVISSLRT